MTSGTAFGDFFMRFWTGNRTGTLNFTQLSANMGGCHSERIRGDSAGSTGRPCNTIEAHRWTQLGTVITSTAQSEDLSAPPGERQD